MEDSERENRKHKKPQAGRKADKKNAEKIEQRKEEMAKLPARERNPKAFAIRNVKKMRRNVVRTLEMKEKKVHIPVVDRTYTNPPPIIVAIVGPPKVGKSLLMKGLIRNYSRLRLTDIKGPVTVVANKTRRITFIECKNDVNSMIDIAKVADLVLLLIDASFGMEMETFEFLNICQVHGFPKIMGILNHLDYFKNINQMRKTKKTLKRRFWQELYKGAKLFNMSGLMYGEYLHHEIHNLCRFISIMKFRPLTWRNSHPYLLADRMEDITDPEQMRVDPTIDRTVSVYGWLRGVPMKTSSTIHIPGCGDHMVDKISMLSDPCPLPDKLKRRRLTDLEKRLYAPLTGVGGIVYDKDAIYIDSSDHLFRTDPAAQKHGEKSKEKEQSNQQKVTFKNALFSTQTPLDEKLKQSSLSLFSNSAAITSEQFHLKTDDMTEEIVDQGGRIRRRVVFNDEEGDIESGDDYQSDDGGEDQLLEGERHRRAGTFLSQSEDEESEKLLYDDDSDDDEIDFNFDAADTSADISLNDSTGRLQGGQEREPMDEDVENEDLEDEDVEDEDLEDEDVEDEDVKDVEDEDEDVENEDEVSEEEMSVDEEDGRLKWKENLAVRAATNYLNRQKSTPNLRKLVYEIDPKPVAEEKNEFGEGLFKVVKPTSVELQMDNNDSTRCGMSLTRTWSDAEAKVFIRDCFVTGKWQSEYDAKTRLEEDDKLRDDDFEDLEKQPGEDEDVEEEAIADEDNPDINNQKSKRMSREEYRKKMEEKRLARKLRSKDLFDSAYDTITDGDVVDSHWDKQKAELEAQAQLNKNEFNDMDDETRALYEGFRSGTYVRIELKNMPCEFITNFDPYAPLVVGGMTSTESVIGATQIRVKKHRWYNKILKTRDPLIFSIGWRRFQSLPLYTIQDHNGRTRALKYTPQYMHCTAVFWGPATPPNSGVLCLQAVSSSMKGFRIAATGVVLAIDKSIVVMKKLKLIGHPMRCHSKTAFIKDMFTSPLEVAKFEGAKLRTVSGIRGEVKKAIKEPPGAFRAKFEDKILMSDIVFAKTWYPVDVPRFYTPVTNMLLKFNGDQKPDWQGMKTLGMLRKEHGTKAPFSADSQLQKEPARKKHYLRDLKIPGKLLRALPFEHKKKQELQFEDPLLSSRVTVVRDSHEMRVDKMLHRMKVLQKSRIENKQQKKKELSHKATKESKNQLQSQIQKRKEARKKAFKEIGIMKEQKRASKLRTNNPSAYSGGK